MKFSRVLLIAAAVFGFSIQSYAKGGGSGITLMPSFMYLSDADTIETPTVTETTDTDTILNLKLGYTTSMGFYFGGIFDSDTNTYKQGATEIETASSSFGASVGYMKGGFNIIASYLLSSSFSQDTGTPSAKVEASGTGIVVDVGYAIMMGSWGFGPQVSYRSFTWDEDVKVGGTAVTTLKYSSSDIVPGIQLKFVF